MRTEQPNNPEFFAAPDQPQASIRVYKPNYNTSAVAKAVTLDLMPDGSVQWRDFVDYTE